MRMPLCAFGDIVLVLILMNVILLQLNRMKQVYNNKVAYPFPARLRDISM